METIYNLLENLHQQNNKFKFTFYEIYKGIYLVFMTISDSEITFHHQRQTNMISIEYCYNGRMGWSTQNGNSVYLGPGDYVLHALDNCTDSKFTFPNNYYNGLSIYIDFNIFEPSSLLFLNENLINFNDIYLHFLNHNHFASFMGNEETESIFKYFYNQPQNIQPVYWKIKTIELFLYLEKIDYTPENHLTEYRSEQIKIIRSIHDDLLTHLNQRLTIDSLAKKYLINPTTLKSIFKDVYGEPIATHIKKHRINLAMKLLRETDKTIAEIAKESGYESQSKFAKTFKNYTQFSPSEYRNHNYNKN